MTALDAELTLATVVTRHPELARELERLGLDYCCRGGRSLEEACQDCGTIRNPVSVMLVEHDQAGELLDRLHTLTGGYTPPPDGCATYRAYYAALAELATDVHLHVHKENNLLFPAVVALEGVTPPGDGGAAAPG